MQAEWFGGNWLEIANNYFNVSNTSYKLILKKSCCFFFLIFFYKKRRASERLDEPLAQAKP